MTRTAPVYAATADDAPINGHPAPSGAVGFETDRGAEPLCRCGATTLSPRNPRRCARGHVLIGNTDSLITGERSAAFWRAVAPALTARVAGILANHGYTEADAPVTLLVAATGTAQAEMVRDSGFSRMVEEGGPLSVADRERGPYKVWKDNADRVLRHTQAIGYGLKQKPAPSVQDWIREQQTRAGGAE